MRIPTRFLAAAGLAAAALALCSAAPAPTAQSAKRLYETARTEEGRLRQSASAKRSRSAWARVGQKYHAVVRAYPRSGYCDDALYYEGGVYRDAAERFDDRELAARARDAFALLSGGYPSSKWAAKALLEQVRLQTGRLDDPAAARRAAERLKRLAPDAPEVRLAAEMLARPKDAPARPAAGEPKPAEALRVADRPAGAAGKAPKRPSSAAAAGGTAGGATGGATSGAMGTVDNIRHWVGESHTRVVIDLSREVPYTEGRLRNPDRVFFDLRGTVLSEELLHREFPIDGSHLQRIRVANHDSGVVRVVLDLASIREMSVFGLPDPYRLVIDIHGAPIRVARADGGAAESGEAPASGAAAANAGNPSPEEAAAGVPTSSGGGYSLARQLGANVQRIVVDAGHGGKDPGTRSGSLREKDIVLDIAKQVEKELTARGFEVIMTRDDDEFVPLEKRAFIANDSGADLFLSIHANAARNRRARGLETFYLNLADSPEAEEVAARENATANVRMADMPKLIEQIMNNNRIEESRELAGAMQQSMAMRVLGREEHPLNRGVKTAGFHVLLGAQMPAILVEVGFVSNRAEAKLLRTETHRKKLAVAISDGVAQYLAGLGQPAATTAAGAPSSPR